jgi:hypothetical protein
MLKTIDSILPKLKTSGAKDDDIVNALTAAYCPTVVADKGASAAARAAQLGNFSVLVYGQIKNSGKTN